MKIFYYQEENITELPKYICQTCQKSIEHIIDFKTKCVERDSQLREMLRLSKIMVNVNIKNEECDLSETLVVDTLKIEEINIEPKLEECDEIPSDYSIDYLKEEKTYNCKICDDFFSTFTKLQEHKNQSHKNCPDCSKSFSKYALMISHRKRVHTIQKCPECKVVFETSALLTNHRILEHQLEESSVKKPCPICGKLFTKNSNIRRHVETVHNNTKRNQLNERHPCPICGKEFKFKENITRHIESVHNKVRNHSCNMCDKSFYEKIHLTNHIALHLEDRPFICDYPGCGKAFKLLQYLTGHQHSHLGLEEKAKLKRATNLFICSYCGKTLTTKINHDHHIRIHTNEKPFKCKICSKAFIRQLTLKVHMRVHTDEKPYRCTICLQNFKQGSHLQAHYLTHDTDKKFSCTICDFSTKYKYNLEGHMRNVHLLERKHQCVHCSDVFFNTKLLRKHVENKHK